jgi:hypothetical protein
MIPSVAWLVRAQGRARQRLLLRPRPGSGKDAIPPEVEVESEPWGRARRRPPFEVEVEAEPWGRARRRPPSEAEAGAEPWGRARRRPPSGVEVEAEPWGRARRRPHSEAEAGAEPWGRARRSFLWRLTLDSAAVSLTLVGGTTVEAGQVALFPCQVSKWRGEVTAVTSALSTEERASG